MKTRTMNIPGTPNRAVRRTPPSVTILAALLLLPLAGVRSAGADGLCFRAGDFLSPDNGSGLNSASSEWTPSLSPDGLTLTFASTRPGGFAVSDLWQAARPNLQAPFGAAVNLGPAVNAAGWWNTHPAVTGDGLELFFTRSLTGAWDDNDLFRASRATTGDPFTGAAAVSELNTAAAEAAPFISADGLTLFFASNRPTSQGDDIWFATRPDRMTPFGLPSPLTGVNSVHDENSFSLTADGLTALLHRVPMSGGSDADIHMACRPDTLTPFSSPVILPALNSAAFDGSPTVTADGGQLFFFSDRPGGSGGFDLWRTWLPVAAPTGGLLAELVSPSPQTNGYYGSGVMAVPDIDGDGYEEIVIVAPGEDPPRAYIYSGIDRHLIRSFILTLGVWGEHSQMSGISDINSDGAGDILIGGVGEVGAYSGSDGSLLHHLNPLNAGFTFGYAVANVPDFTGDGVEDIIVGASNDKARSEPNNTGKAYLFSGASGDLVAELWPDHLPPGASFGNSVSGVPDVDGDGLGDVVIGARTEDDGVGRAYIFSGGTGELIRQLEPLDLVFDYRFGVGVAGMPDIDGDGRGDILVSADGPNDIYVISGASGVLIRRIDEPETLIDFGSFIDVVPDTDGDFIPDILVGAYSDSASGVNDAGRSFLYSVGYGSLLFSLESTHRKHGGKFGAPVAGISDLDNDGRGDLIVGAFKEDGPPGYGSTGRAYVFSGAGILRPSATPTPSPTPPPPGPTATPTPTPGVRTLPYFEDFDGAVFDWVLDNSFGSSGGGLWRMLAAGECKAALSGHSAPGAMAYTLPPLDCDYETFTATSGQVLSPPIILSGAAPQLTLKYFLDTEGPTCVPGGFYDLATIDLSAGGGAWQTLAGNCAGGLTDGGNTWRTLTADLSPWTGQTIRLRATFDTIDEYLNDHPGFYIDDVAIMDIPAPSPTSTLTATSTATPSPTPAPTTTPTATRTPTSTATPTPVQVVFNNPASVAISSEGPAAVYPSVISVSGLFGPVERVTIDLFGLSHAYPDDLDILVKAPNGAGSVILVSDCGGGMPVGGVNLTLQHGGPSLPDSSPLASGVWGPTDHLSGDSFPPPGPGSSYGTKLSVYNVADASVLNGDWELYVFDDTTGDAGSLAGGWGVNVFIRPDLAPTVTPTPTATATPTPTPDCDAWELELTIPDPTPDINDPPHNFGYSVSVDEGRALAGAFGVNFYTGRAYLFDAGTGSLLRSFNHPAPIAYDYFGTSVCLRDGQALVGAPGPGAGFTGAGRAFLFNADTGAVVHTFLKPAPAPFDQFGSSLWLADDLAIVGAHGDDTTTSNGSAYVFDALTGTLLHTFYSPNPSDSSQFGNAVCVSGGIALVADSKDSTAANEAGAAYLFDVSTGTILHTLLHPSPAAMDFFGSSVSLNGGRALVGASADDAGDMNSGSGHLFDVATGAWLQSFEIPGPSSGAQLGTSSSLRGNQALLGARYDDTGAPNTGAAYLFATQTGALISAIHNPVPNLFDSFGDSVSLSDGVMMIGASSDNTVGEDSGSAYLFVPNSDPVCPTVTPMPTLPASPSPTSSATPGPTATATPAATSTPSPSPAPCCPGDADNSGGSVNAADFLAVQANFGANNGPGGLGDADCSGGSVNAADFLAVQANFGSSCG